MKLTLVEFDEYAKKLVSSKVKKEPLKYYEAPDSSHYGFTYLVDIDHTYSNIKISGNPRYNEKVPIIKKSGNQHIEYGSGLEFITYENINKKMSLHEKHKDLFKDIPTLSVNIRDISYASIYITNKSNLRDFANDIKRISLIATITDEEKKRGLNTLFVKKQPNNNFILKYSPEFIAKCILEDYIYHYAKMPGYENYKGAFTSFCYLIGHELLHYRNNHFDPIVHKTIKRLIYPANKKAPHDTPEGKQNPNELIIDSIVRQESEAFPEYQNNALMSSILDVTTVDMGLGRIFNKKSNDYSGLYSGYIKIDKKDTDPSTGKSLVQTLSHMSHDKLKKMGKDGWAFTGVKVILVDKAVNMRDLRDRTHDKDSSYYDKEKDPNDIIWPIITPYPTGDDIAKLLTLFFLTFIPVSEEALKKQEPKRLKGYQIGDEIIIKSSGKKGIVTDVQGGEITVSVDEPGPQDEAAHLLDIINGDENLRGALGKAKHIHKIFRDKGVDIRYTSDIKKSLGELTDRDLKAVVKGLQAIVDNKADNEDPEA